MPVLPSPSRMPADSERTNPEQTHASVTPAAIPDIRSEAAPAALVQDAEGLSKLLAVLESEPGADVGLDTEADSFHHYFEKICLLQIATKERVFVVDPLVRLDLAGLFRALSQRRLLIHGADFDLRLLFRSYGFRAAVVFDSMLAAQLVGEPEWGLAALLKRRLGLDLDKTHQRCDWSERPLSPERLGYAAADVRHLAPLAESLERELAEKRRIGWHQEECARLLASPLSPRDKDPDEDWRIKGTNALTNRERAYARELWRVREARAQALDRPPFRVLTNERLLAAARLAATGVSDLAKLFPGPKPLPAAFAAATRSALLAARLVPREAWPGPRTGPARATDARLEAEVARLKGLRDVNAKALDIEPSVLASRQTLTSLARLFLESGGRKGFDGVEETAEATGIARWRLTALFGKPRPQEALTAETAVDGAPL